MRAGEAFFAAVIAFVVGGTMAVALRDTPIAVPLRTFDPPPFGVATVRYDPPEDTEP